MIIYKSAMVLLNYIYFLIITIIGIKFLFSGGKVVHSPFGQDIRMKLNGPEVFWCLTFATGLLAFSAPGALDLMAVRLLVLEVLCFIGIFIAKDKPVWTPALMVYAVYILWIVIGCFYSPAPAYGFRVVLKYLYPILLCLFASAAVRYAEVFIKSALLARTVAFVCVIFSFVPLIGRLIPGVFWYDTARAINFISIMTLSIGLFYFTKEKRKNLIYAIIFILPCFLWVFRTSIMGSFVAIMAFYFIKYKLKSLPIIFGIIVLGVVAVFTIPSLRDKMFKKEATGISIENFQQGKVGMEEVNTNAREGMWKYLENRFYTGHEIAGSGTGSVQNHMYKNILFGGLKVPHSDFVQMKCDNGLIGLILYAATIMLMFIHCFKVYWTRSSSNVLRLAAIVAGASILGVFATLYSDNAVNYSMATLSMPFGFYGMMLGLKTAKNRQS